jgi:hypothetical protein
MRGGIGCGLRLMCGSILLDEVAIGDEYGLRVLLPSSPWVGMEVERN